MNVMYQTPLSPSKTRFVFRIPKLYNTPIKLISP